jgi:3-hydroxyacyl-CoA dehydrogenase/enoyl-CoA hydratase/3-hydroxybutyryl-CoA epimerase
MESTVLREPFETAGLPRRHHHDAIAEEIHKVEQITAEVVKLEDEMETITPQHVREAGPAFRLEVEDNIGILIFDSPTEKVNILSTPVMQELNTRLDELQSRADLQALILLSGKDGNFIAGAKIEEIENITDPKDGAEKAAMGQAVFSKIAALPFPTIAVIDGACVGGGLELVLACDYRLARDSEKTRLGLPEVRLGIIPGFGGTQRLPRLIGIQRALDFILTGKLVDAQRAYRAGLVDRLIAKEFPPQRLRRLGVEFAREIQKPETRQKIAARRNRLNPQTLLLEKNFLGRKVLFDQARRRIIAETKGHYPAPELALEAVEKGFSKKDIADGLKIEAELLGKAIVTNVSKNLVKIFYLTEAVKKDSGVENYPGPIQEFQKIGVLGAGVMGGGIAQLMAHNDLPARMKDVNLAAVAKGMEAAARVFSESVKKRRMTPKEMQNKMALISGTADYSGFNHVDLVIEAIVEILEVKKKVFAEIDAIVPAHCIVVSNTSSLPITEMAKATKRPDKFAGLHFFNPVHRMPLVEVIRGKSTSDATIASLVAFARKIGKTPIVVKDSPGFLVNRILGAYMAEAGRLLREGATVEQIDNALLEFGMPMGPINLFDEVGLDVAAKVSHILENAFGSRMAGEGMMDKIVESGRLGKKNGKGFYIYEGKNKKVDPAIYAFTGKAGKFEGSAAEIQDRCVLPMINEAAMCLAEGIVRRPADVDVGMIFGTGFPPFRGGLLRYADAQGIDNIVGKLETLAGKYGERFKAADLLVGMKNSGGKFYS